jgi:hypothetical protein
MLDGLISGGLGLLGGIFSNQSNRDIANQTNQFSAEQYAKRYQTTVKDLQAAGLSPMLAYSQGAGSAPSGQVGAPQQNVATSALEGYHKASERELMKSEIALKDESAKNQNAQANEAKSRTWNNQLDYAIKELEVKKATAAAPYFASNADISNLKLKRESELITEQIDKVAQDVLTGKASAAQLKAFADQLKASTTNLDLDSNEKAAMAALWKHLGEGGAAAKEALPFLRLLKSILGK